jgi:50S ribosomal subunit-associated GTPase HflX
MIDNSLKQIDKDLKKLINENCILVFNKSDLNKKIPKNEFIKNDQILISVKDNQNIDKLVKTIKDKLSKKFTQR